MTSAQNRLVELALSGQSVWLDYIRRSILSNGELKRHVEEDQLKGVTSNPAIFEKAIAGSSDYAADLASEGERCSRDPKGVYERLAIADIQRAADVLLPVYRETRRRDGYVSLEVSPLLAHDTAGTLAEARRLWQAVARENLMIKVPGTVEGVPAIRQLISEGINVNVTLLFAVEAYQKVAAAYIAGLELRLKAGKDISRVASVASFFVSRIDSLVDPQLEQRSSQLKNEADRKLAASLRGKIAIANAKVAYELYSKLVASPGWKDLEKRGAMTQRLLWASTSTKDARLRDVLYVEELIGKDTVNTIPPATFDAFKDHGVVKMTLAQGLPEAHATMSSLAKVDISIEKVTAELLDQGVKLFADAFDKLLKAVAAQGSAQGAGAAAASPATSPSGGARLAAKLPDGLARAVRTQLDGWQSDRKSKRLWDGDASLWTGRDEGKWLGWLTIPERQLAQLARFTDLQQDVRKGGFEQLLLLGMGGSSLCPEVLALTFGKLAGAPELLVLDSTDPAQVRAVERKLDLGKTLFIVSSKSGSTLEPNIFKQYFYERVKQTVPGGKPGSQFIAITDPGSAMQMIAENGQFRRVCAGVPSIGGRYSALSDFGVVPAALMGLDVKKLLERSVAMAKACGPGVAAADNPGVHLGAILGTAATQGRDKVTIVTSSSIRRLGAWLEQLLAESTGKNGKALIPVDLEPLGKPEVYGDDRVFVSLAMKGDADAAQEAALAALEKAGHPVVRLALDDTYDIFGEFFRWEIATVVAGEILRINPFDQPDVEASKIETRKLTIAYETSGKLPPESPLYTEGGMSLFTDAENARALGAAVGAKPSLTGYLRAHLQRVKPGDYIALLAYVEMNESHESRLSSTRLALRDQKRVATCLGFGPRFLHSTGQAYKGGPNTGVVLQITCDDAEDLAVPGQRFTFGVVKAAQARGDFAVLAERKRRALRVHLGRDVAAGLEALGAAVSQALRG